MASVFILFALQNIVFTFFTLYSQSVADANSLKQQLPTILKKILVECNKHKIIPIKFCNFMS